MCCVQWLCDECNIFSEILLLLPSFEVFLFSVISLFLGPWHCYMHSCWPVYVSCEYTANSDLYNWGLEGRWNLTKERKIRLLTIISIPFTFKVLQGFFCILFSLINSYFSSCLPFQVLFILSFPSDKVTICFSWHFYLGIQYGSPQLAEGKKPKLFICPDKCFHSPCFQWWVVLCAWLLQQLISNSWSSKSFQRLTDITWVHLSEVSDSPLTQLQSSAAELDSHVNVY